MTVGAPGSFGAQLKALREAAGYTQEELATIAGLSVHAVSALERGERRRPHVETVRALSAAFDLTGTTRDVFVASARARAAHPPVDALQAAALPLSLTALLGRDADLLTVRRWLADPAVRLITLTGPGGVGKTRLALEVAHAMAGESGTHVLFVPLAAIHNPAFVVPAIAEALGLANVTAHDLPKRTRIACADRPTLLVLDNFEQVLDAAPLVADLLITVASLRVLVTSRAPLRTRGEREYAVRPLALDDSAAMSPADLAHSPAVRLFMERVRDVHPDFRLTVEKGHVVAAICRRLDALPLAIELAAPWMKVLTAENLLRRLEQDVLLAPVRARDLPARQQTMNATVAWSYRLLGAREQRAFRCLGAIPGRFSLDAAAAVLGESEGSPATGDDALAAVVGLIDKSLLLRAETSVSPRPLYQMLESVRAFAVLELAAAGERDHALEGLARHCVSEASRAALGLGGPAQAEWLHRVRDDLENYRTALAWLIERGRPSDAITIASGLMFFWTIRGRTAEGLQWYEQTLRLQPLPPGAESRALVGASLMWYSQGDLERARALLTRARARAVEAGDRGVVTQSDYLLGRIEYASGHTDDARAWFMQSLQGFRALEVPWGIRLALNGMAWIALAAGDIDEAERLLDETASSIRHAGPWFLSATQNLRAVVAIRRSDPDTAIAWVRRSLTQIRELQDTFAFAYALVPLAAAAVLRGDEAWAARILGTQDAVMERAGVVIADMPVRELREQAERKARARLGPDRWAVAYAAGRETSIDALLKDIDSSLPIATA
jgi:predicted ATPase/DNA-binding XRE family transcriptional regulator